MTTGGSDCARRISDGASTEVVRECQHEILHSIVTISREASPWRTGGTEQLEYTSGDGNGSYPSPESDLGTSQQQ